MFNRVPPQVTVVLKRLFTPAEAADGGATFVSELEADVTTECKRLGTIEKVCVCTIFAWGGGGGWGRAAHAFLLGYCITGSLHFHPTQTSLTTPTNLPYTPTRQTPLQVRVFPQHPEGVVTVRFKQAEPAEQCVALMDGRFFGGRQLVAHMWDGFTQFHGVSLYETVVGTVDLR